MEQLRLIARFLWPWVRRYRLRLAGAVLAGALFGASNAGVLWLTRTVLERLEDDPAPAAESVEAAPGEGLAAEAGAVDRFLDRWLPRRGEPAGMLQYLSLILGLPLLISIRSSWEYLSAYWMSWVGERVVNDLRVKVLGKLSGLPLGYFDKAKMGDMITRINGDTLMLQNCITHGIKNSVSHPVTVLVVFLYLVRMDWQLMLGIAALLPGTLVPLLIFGRKARAASAGRVRANVVQSSLLVEMLSAIRVVKAYCLESREVERFRNLSRQIFSHTMRGVRAQEIVGPIIETLSMLAVGTLIVFVILTDRSIADLVTFFAGLFMFYESIKKLAKLHVLFSQTSVGVQRLESILAEQPEVADPGRGLPVDRFERGIRFQGVSFAYREEQVLEDIDLAIPRGTRLGIAGESGSGKTTLIHLLLRFFEPDRGRILLDGADLADLRVRDCRQLMALVSQDVVVFDQSVADNIGCGRAGATREEIERAAEQAHATGFIRELEHGFDTWLGERGVTLSGGQRQRIAIARAFVRDAPILILDEATASLDARSEAEVQLAIDDLARSRTVICIAHRLSTLRSMDRIVVLEKGRIREEGSYESLLSAGGAFAAMARRQGIADPD